jgi:hydrogenase small subunit
MSVSRRDFLKASSMLAAAFGLQVIGDDEAGAAEKLGGVIWLQGQGCTGCSMSLLSSLTGGPCEELLRHKMELKFHPTLMTAAGPNAVAAALAARAHGGYVLIVEGAIPTAAGGKFCYLWPGTTAWDGVQEFAKKAEYIVAVGTCAAYGGIPASVPPHGANLTGAKGLSQVVRGKTIINVPGCPPHPDWVVGTIASLLSGIVPARDAHGRPEAYFSNTIHNQCPYEDSYAEKYCLEELGCKGSITYGNCPGIRWNSMEPDGKGVNWCIGARSPCRGCTQPDFPDAMLPFHAEVED